MYDQYNESTENQMDAGFDGMDYDYRFERQHPRDEFGRFVKKSGRKASPNRGGRKASPNKRASPKRRTAARRTSGTRRRASPKRGARGAVLSPLAIRKGAVVKDGMVHTPKRTFTLAAYKKLQARGKRLSQFRRTK